MKARHVINLSTAWEPPAEGLRAWVRRFGRPSGVEPGDRVWIVIEGGMPATLVINGACLPSGAIRHEVTDLLEPRNELLLVPQGDESAASRPGDATSSPALSHGRRDLAPQHGRVSLEIEAVGS